jgi:ADP-heptose:LPS heptosyltransferase
MLPDGMRDLKRILAVRLDNIGDVIMLSPVLRALKASFPGAHLTLMASPAGSQVAPMLPWVDEIIAWRAVWQEIKGRFDQGPEQELELINLLTGKKFDAAFIFTSFSQSPYPPAYACYLAGIPNRVGQSKEFGGYLLTQWVKPTADSDYQVDRNLHLLSSIGLPIRDNRIELYLSKADQSQAEEILNTAGLPSGAPYIVAAPGATAAARRYDPARFALVVDILSRLTGHPVIVIGTERERSLGILNDFIDAAKNNSQIIPIIGKTNVPQMAAIIQKSILVLTNNSASLHIAEAFGRPMVILYSGTEYLSQWAPRYTQALILHREVSCSPCFSFNCPYEMQCLDISPREVIHKTLRFLKQLPISEGPIPTFLRPSLIEGAK